MSTELTAIEVKMFLRNQWIFDETRQYITDGENHIGTFFNHVHSYAAITAKNSTYGKGLDPEKIEECVEALEEIANICGTVNYSSFNQMKEAVQAAQELAEAVLLNARIK